MLSLESFANADAAGGNPGQTSSSFLQFYFPFCFFLFFSSWLLVRSQRTFLVLHQSEWHDVNENIYVKSNSWPHWLDTRNWMSTVQQLDLVFVTAIADIYEEMLRNFSFQLELGNKFAVAKLWLRGFLGSKCVQFCHIVFLSLNYTAGQ